MKTRLGWTIALIELASLFFLALLLNQQGLPARVGIILVFLLPISFGLHVLEEFFFPGGYTDWYKSYNPRLAQGLSSAYLFKVNAFPLAASVLVCLGAFDYRGSYSFFGIRAWLAFLSLLTFNALFHIRGAIRTKRYSPGVAVSVVLYLPLAVISFTYLLRSGVVDFVSAIICLALGSLFQPALDYLKKQGLKKGKQPV